MSWVVSAAVGRTDPLRVESGQHWEYLSRDSTLLDFDQTADIADSPGFSVRIPDVLEECLARPCVPKSPINYVNMIASAAES